MIEFRKVILPDEVDVVQEIDRRIFASFPGDLFDAEEWNGLESYWMVEHDEIVGCSAFIRHVDYDETPREGCLHIVSTGVLPEARGLGLGRKQKEWQIEFARREGFHTIVTNMRRSNAQIIHLNSELGFEERKIHPNFYADPQEDGIVMERHISPNWSVTNAQE